MRLAALLQNIISIPADFDRDIKHLVLDSRQVKKGDLFFAIKGTQLDGRKFIPDVIAKGVAAVLVDSSEQELHLENNVPLIPIDNLQQKIAEIAARFYDFPAKKLRMLGVTGTNGKTSCSHFIAQILQSLNIPCGIIGTLGSGFYGALQTAGLTTPDAISLQALLQQFVQQQAQAVAMEVSSHSIHQGRVNAIDFEIGIFTNLTQDHLDYHGDMETYANVKKRFFAEFPTKNSVINADDTYGKKWLTEFAKHKSIYAYSCEKPQHTDIPTIYADQIQLTLQGIKAKVFTPWGNGEINLPLIGRFNLSNVLAVIAALGIYGIPLENILQQVNRFQPVPGRMQALGGQQQPLVVVDYAHTPDALEKVLQALRLHTQGKLICVFGCGGDRDQGKRPLMAKIVEQYADHMIVTNDNPRHENPETIAQQILQGFSQTKPILVELDRSKAIKNSIQSAAVDDCILIAGKGAELYQQIGDNKLPFSDVEEVRKWLVSPFETLRSSGRTD